MWILYGGKRKKTHSQVVLTKESPAVGIQIVKKKNPSAKRNSLFNFALIHTNALNEVQLDLAVGNDFPET